MNWKELIQLIKDNETDKLLEIETGSVNFKEEVLRKALLLCMNKLVNYDNERDEFSFLAECTRRNVNGLNFIYELRLTEVEDVYIAYACFVYHVKYSPKVKS
jgi:hypothetical protein